MSVYRVAASEPDDDIACPSCRGMSGFVELAPEAGTVTFHRCTICASRGFVSRVTARMYWQRTSPSA